MPRFSLLITLVLVLSACGQESKTDTADDIDLIVHCGNLIDGISDAPLGERIVVIRGNRITDILSSDDPAMADAEILNLSDQTCLPGLIDTHVHLEILPEDADDYRIYLRRTVDDTQRLAEKNSGITLRSGFTTVRHVGAYSPAVIRKLRRDIERLGTIVKVTNIAAMPILIGLTGIVFGVYRRRRKS